MAFSKDARDNLIIYVNLTGRYSENDAFDRIGFYMELAKDVQIQFWEQGTTCFDAGVEIEIFGEFMEEFCTYLENYVWETLENKVAYDVVEVHVKNDTEVEVELERYILEKCGKKLENQLEKVPLSYQFPVKYSPEMTAYIDELSKVAANLNKIGELSQVFSKNLLISMDDGWGYSAFLKCIRWTFSPYYDGADASYEISEQKVEREKGVEAWEVYPKAIKEKNRQLERNGHFSIISFDMTDWIDLMEDKELLNYIRRIGQYATHAICIFRFPYMDRKDIRRFERSLSTVVSLRTLVIPPVSISNMILYIKELIGNKNFCVADDVDGLLEQWICQVKNEGVFYGYKTMDKMVAELIYQKALHVTEKDDLKKIVAEDVSGMLTDAMLDKDPYELLDELIGMDAVKQKIREIVAQVKVQQDMVKKGKAVEPPTIHMMFLGNPGTGKTTVARILGMIFKKEDILKKGYFIEKQGSDFVQRYIGQSAQAMREACRDAYGNVLFIDEAYGMSVAYSRGNASDETLPTLVAEMENNRDKMCVILAGYSEEMKEFVKENSGLSSRIPHIIEFPNYSRDELVEILFTMIEGKFKYEEDFKETITDYIQKLPDSTLESKEFSNARFVRNLFENLWGKAAYRISLSGEKEIVLKKEDVVSVIQENKFEVLNTEKTRRIGFI